MYIYISFAIVLTVLIALELVYFKTADKYNIFAQGY